MVAQGINMNGVVSRCLLQMIHSVAFYDMQAHSSRILKFAQRDVLLIMKIITLSPYVCNCERIYMRDLKAECQ